MSVERHLHTLEVVGSNPAVPTNPFNNLAVGLPAACAALRQIVGRLFSPPFISVAYTDPTISCTLSGSSCMYSLAVVSGPRVPQVRLNVHHRSHRLRLGCHRPSHL